MNERVLLLNGNYIPLASITVPKAVNLLISEKVMAVEGILKTLQTPSTTFDVPSVIVLKRYVNVPNRDKKWSRRGVLERDSFTCIFCEARAGTDRGNGRWRVRDFTIEHIIPVSRGGKSTWGNTACACYPCNHTKADRTPTEVGFKLLWEPKTPRTNYWVVSGNFPIEWKKYFEG
jgi:5-methylcytosine-specific restriction endonuclease McrA